MVTQLIIYDHGCGDHFVVNKLKNKKSLNSKRVLFGFVSNIVIKT